MKITLVALTLFVLSIKVFGQNKKIDNLIQRIDNSSIRVNHTGRLWLLDFDAKPMIQLIKIGKVCSSRLIQALDDSSKTIVAHYALTKIWTDTFSYFNEWNRYYSDTIIDYSFNGLSFYWKNKYYVPDTELPKIRLFWKDFIRREHLEENEK